MKALLILAALFSQLAFANEIKELVIYSDRNPAWFDVAIADFKKATGTEVIILQVNHSELVQRLVFEGDQTPADLIISKDLAYVTEMTKRGLVQALPEIDAFNKVPEGMLSEDRLWSAITYRSRAVIYNANEFSPEDFTTYADLADPKWGDQLCVRQGSHNYNLGLVSSLIVAEGLEAATSIIEGWVANLAKPSFKKDSHVIAAVADGTCGVGIINHYYLGQALNKNPELPVRFKFLDQDGNGSHTNGTSVLMSKHSSKTEKVRAFLEALYSKESLNKISSSHFDFPARTDMTASTLVGEWGPNSDGQFLKQGISWQLIGEQKRLAIGITRDAGWN